MFLIFVNSSLAGIESIASICMGVEMTAAAVVMVGSNAVGVGASTFLCHIEYKIEKSRQRGRRVR